MYQYQKYALEENSFRYELFNEGDQLSYHAFLDLLQQDKSFQSYFINILSDISFHSYQWETPPISKNTVDQPFEFVIHDSPGIDLPPDPGPFQRYFNEGKENDIAVFENLGRDAKLIAPAPSDQDLNYSHIGVFTRNAPLDQQHKLWQTAGKITKQYISDQPLWLNTAGGGVAWLHVRLDSRPKYYRHRPYIK